MKLGRASMARMRLGRARTARICLLAGGLALAGCGAASTTSPGGGTASGPNGAGSSGSSSGSSTGEILRIPYLADMSVPDPDVFYDIEGNSVILSSYDGLVTYAANSTKIVPDLATSWKVSGDRLTYTFTLRRGVHFHDGTLMTSDAVKRSFERRLAVNQAPSYMLKPIASMATPTPSTFVVRLKNPVNPFIDYMASSWGPKVIGPGALVTHAGSDHGQAWLASHEDGTGPYELTAFDRGRQYVLTRSATYWGGQPYFKQILLKITPDIGTQQLELKNGDVDGVLHSFPASELNALPSNVRVDEFPSFLRLLLYVNTNKPPFDDPAVRASLRSDINISQLVAEAYSGTATPSIGAYPEAILPNQPRLPYAPNAKLAAAGARAASTKSITLAYTADESGVQRRVGELIQADLAAAGWNVTVKEVQLPQVYGYVNNLKAAPDLMLQTNTPDAAHPDTWARILFESTGGLNFLGFKDPTVDGLLNQALSAAPARAAALYQQVGAEVVKSNEIFFLGDVKNVFVLNRGLTGVAQVPAYPWTVTLASLRRAGG